MKKNLKSIRKNVFAVVLGIIFISNISAQTIENNKPLTPTHGIEIGYNHEIFSIASPSIYLGYNRSYKITDYIDFDLQSGASYSRFTQNDNFFGRDKGNKYTVSTYTGIKTYIISPKSPIRFYVQTLLGAHLQIDNYADEERKDTVIPSLGFSVGLFGEWKNIYGGIANERGL